jgi:monothiol glutaredoxin
MPLSEAQRASFDALVRSKDVVLFMKGNRLFPQCGFSATVVGLLDGLGCKYETVDILRDPSVREGMKEYSSWQTFPQLYVRGEFVGGCDIVKAMAASGELPKLLGVEDNPVTPPSITVTSAAAKAFGDAMADAGDEVLRLAIDARFDNDLHFGPKQPGDVVVTAGGVGLHLDRATAARAAGVTIDYVESRQGMAFKIDNPNEPPRVKPLTARQLKDLLDGGKVELFDVRPEDERSRAAIGAARKLDGEGERYLLGLGKEQAIAFHCHHGMRSRAAAEELLGHGFTNVYNLEGGIDAWSQDVDPSVPRY